MNLKDRARQLMRDIPAIMIALRDKQIPIMAKVLAGLVVVYALSPVDLIPDFIPVLGYLDDIIILPALIALTIKMIPAEVMNKCRVEAEGISKITKNWFYAIPFVIIWILILLIIYIKIFS
jgi:uncharacterized membrane protein YkvA (DUF1232 family)